MPHLAFFNMDYRTMMLFVTAQKIVCERNDPGKDKKWRRSVELFCFDETPLWLKTPEEATKGEDDGDDVCGNAPDAMARILQAAVFLGRPMRRHKRQPMLKQ